MAVLNPPLAVQARTDHNADDFRGALMAGMVGQGSASLLPRGGILPGWGAELSVAQNGTPNMSVNVGSGKVLVPAPTAGHGGWFVVNDASLNLAIAASHATLPRTDLIIARVGDAQYYTGGDGLAAVKVITGTAGSGAPVPAVPVADGANIVLGQVAVAAAATTITNANITLNTSASRPFTVAAGGVLPVANAAARTALTAYLGMHVIEADTAREYVCTVAPSTWQLSFDPGAYLAYTPTLTGWALGNGTIVGRYKQFGKAVHFRIIVTAGSTTTYGQAELGLPVAFAASGIANESTVRYTDTSAASLYEGVGQYNGTTTIYAFVGGGASGGIVSMSTTAPFTWAVGDFIYLAGTYEAA